LQYGFHSDRILFNPNIGDFMPKTEVVVKLIGEDGNAFNILGKTIKALKAAGHEELAKQYEQEATAGNYDTLLYVTSLYVEIE
jgi:hypothetical protein